jgi:hypothetical protein
MTLVGRAGFGRSVAANAVLDDDVHWMDGCLGLGRTVALCEGQAVPGNVRVRSAQSYSKCWQNIDSEMGRASRSREGRNLVEGKCSFVAYK